MQKMFPKPRPGIPLTSPWPALSHVPTHVATEPEESAFYPDVMQPPSTKPGFCLR